MMTVSEIYTTSPTQGPEKVLESFALLEPAPHPVQPGGARACRDHGGLRRHF